MQNSPLFSPVSLCFFFSVSLLCFLFSLCCSLFLSFFFSLLLSSLALPGWRSSWARWWPLQTPTSVSQNLPRPFRRAPSRGLSRAAHAARRQAAEAQLAHLQASAPGALSPQPSALSPCCPAGGSLVPLTSPVPCAWQTSLPCLLHWCAIQPEKWACGSWPPSFCARRSRATGTHRKRPSANQPSRLP